MNIFKDKKRRGLTLVEILMTVTLMAIMVGFVSSWTMSVLNRAELQSTTEALVGILRKTQNIAHNNGQNAGHGILLEQGKYTTFMGNSFASSSTSSRQEFQLDPNIRIQNINLNGGGSEVIFLQKTGNTNQNGSFNVAETNSAETFTVTISTLGLIDWQ